MEAVASRSGVAKTTIYRHWPDQASLLLAAFSSTLVEPPIPDTGTLHGDLLQLVAGLTAAVTSGPASSLMPALIDAAERDPAIAALHRREADIRHRAIVYVIERWVGRGELPPDTDSGLVLELLAGPVFYRRWVTGDPLDMAYATAVVTSVLRASAVRGDVRFEQAAE